MPGLFGVLSRTAELPGTHLANLAYRMASSMLCVPWLQTEIWADRRFCGGRVHLGILNAQPQPYAAETLPQQVWFDGEIYGEQEGRSVNPTAEQVVGYYADQGERLAEVDGLSKGACVKGVALPETLLCRCQDLLGQVVRMYLYCCR